MTRQTDPQPRMAPVSAGQCPQARPMPARTRDPATAKPRTPAHQRQRNTPAAAPSKAARQAQSVPAPVWPGLAPEAVQARRSGSRIEVPTSRNRRLSGGPAAAWIEMEGGTIQGKKRMPGPAEHNTNSPCEQANTCRPDWSLRLRNSWKAHAIRPRGTHVPSASVESVYRPTRNSKSNPGATREQPGSNPGATREQPGGNPGATQEL